MAFSITCDHCSAKLKTATAIPVGRSVTCPKCKKNFAVSDANMEEVADAKTAMTARENKPAATSAKPAQMPTRRAVDDDDDRPRSRNRDDDDDRPSKKLRDDGEDDRLSKKRRDDDDEDNRPRRKSGDDDDDDKPRSRKRDDDDDRPGK